MCQSIKTLRPPTSPEVTTEDIEAAALQYIRKVTGFREPSRANAEPFWAAVDAVAQATDVVLSKLVVRKTIL